MKFHQRYGFAIGGFAVGNAAKMNGSSAEGTIIGIQAHERGRTKITIEFDTPQPVDIPEGSTSRRFELDHRGLSATWRKPLTAVFSRYAGVLSIEETSIDDIPRSEQAAFWALQPDGTGPLTDQDANRLYAAWQEAQEAYGSEFKGSDTPAALQQCAGQISASQASPSVAAIEATVRTDYERYLGQEVLVHRICGYVADDSVDLDLDPPARVRIEKTSATSLTRWIDAWCDPLYEVTLVQPHPQLVEVRSLWIYGQSYHLDGKQVEASDIVEEVSATA